MRKNIIERAYELARSGAMIDVLHIKMKLNAEGYNQADAHLDGAQIRAELRRLITASYQGDLGSMTSRVRAV